MMEMRRSGEILKIEGEFTIYHAAEALARFREELAAGPARALDLAGVEELDTAGAQLLLWLKREGQARGLAIPFTHHSQAVLEVIDQLNLAGAFGDTLVLAPTS